MKVIELTNPRALLLPEVQDFLREAIEAVPFVAPGGFDTVAWDLVNFVQDDHQFIFLGAEDGIFKSVIMGFLPVGQMFPYPTVTLMYNKGSKALSLLTRDTVMDFLLSSGYTRVLAVNASGAPDAAWLRTLLTPTAEGNKVGSLMLLEAK